jgi:hypothetical protein
MRKAKTELEVRGYALNSSTKWAPGDLVLHEFEPGSYRGQYYFVVAGGTQGVNNTDEGYIYTYSSKKKADGSYRIPREPTLWFGKDFDWVEPPKYFDGSILGMNVAGVELHIEVADIRHDEDGGTWMYRLMDSNHTEVSEEQLDRMVGRVVML